MSFNPIPPPQLAEPVAGVMTVKCECGWEMVFLQPEEHIVLLNTVFEHLKQVHGIAFPVLCCYWH